MAYSCYALITIQNEKVAANETDFPVLVKGTYDGTGGEPDIRTVGNGGNVQNTALGGASGAVTVPADFVFAANSDGSSPYDFGIEYYDPATGYIVAWVEIPSLSSGEDTLFYMVYNDSEVVVSQEDVAGTWESSFLAVYHLGEEVEGVENADAYHDSTGNNYHGEDNISSTGQSTEGIGYGKQFDGTDDYIDLGTAWGNFGTDDFTVTAWIHNPKDGEHRAILSKGQVGAGDILFYVDNNNAIRVYGNAGGINALLAFSAGVWTHYCVTRISTTVVLTRDGAATNTDASAGDDLTNAHNWIIGAAEDGTARFWKDYLDEIRVSSVGRDSDYITTDFNTQSAPASFYSMGAEQEAGGGTNYNASLTLARTAGCSASASAATLAAATLARQNAISQGAAAATLAAASLAREMGIAQGAQAAALASTTLAREAGMTDGASAAASASLQLDIIKAVTQAAVAAALGDVTLANERGIAVGATSAAAASFTTAIYEALGFTIGITATLTLARSNAVTLGASAAARANVAFEEMLGASFSASAATLAGVDLQKVLQVAASALAAASATIAVARSLGVAFVGTESEAVVAAVALTLQSRDLSLTLQERSLALTLISRALGFTLQERD